MIIHEVHLTDIYIKFYANTKKQTKQKSFFSASYVNFTKIDHLLVHRLDLNKCKKIEITACILSDHNGIKYSSISLQATESTHKH